MSKKNRRSGEYIPEQIVKALRKSALKHRSNAAPGKRRVGLHKYLKRVYRTYCDISLKRNFERIMREIVELAEVNVRKDTHPLRILIDASVGPEDPKQKSRWVQALQYVYGWKLPARKVEWCFKVSSGVYGCARKQAALNRIARQKREAAF